MGSDFPVPRSQLPRVEVTPHERQARKLQMERMLQNAIDEYDRFREVDQGRVDPSRWKLADSRDALRVYREREVGAGSSSSTSSTPFKSSSSVPVSGSAPFSTAGDDDSTSTSSHGYWEDIPFEATSAAALSDGRHKIKSVLMVGDLPGRVESILYAAITKTNNELALVQTFLHDDVADCAILNELDGPTPENPLHFLGYKWFVKKAPGGGRLVKHRDVVYLEYCGIATSRAGEELGYLLIESVDLPGFPELTNRNCVRAVQSVSILLRQKSDTVVDVFLTGVVEPAGKMMRQVSSLLTSQTLFILTKAMELAECKRLTKMLVVQRRAREEALFNSKLKSTACALCHQKRKFYNGVSLVDCSICGHVICTRCQTHKRVFIADGVLGRFHRVGCCKTCVLAADRSRARAAQASIKMSISEYLQRQNSRRDVDAAQSLSFARPRSSSDSSVGDIAEYSVNQPLRATIEEEIPPVEASRSRRGSVDHVSSSRPPAPGITLLPSTLVPRDRSLKPQQATPPCAALVRATTSEQTSQRHRTGSSATSTGRYLLTQGQEPPAPIRPSPSPPTFTSSAPAGTYDLRGRTLGGPASTAMASPQVRLAPSGSASSSAAGSSPQDLYARMMELRRLAESTYQTTRQNELIMQQQQQQRTPSHAAQQGRPGVGRF